jgi:pyruvate dehydrogenase E2 component (dihydrolipoamide acetyltransferase)
VTTEVVLPELGENIESADVTAVLVAAGDLIRKDQPVIEIETEKASLEVPASAAGRVAELLVSPGETINVGQVILVMETLPGQVAEGASGVVDEPTAPGVTGEPGPPLRPEPAPRPGASKSPDPDETAIAFEFQPGPAEPSIGETVPAAPSVRALAREIGVNIREVPGSGKGGRISRDDVKGFAKRLIRRAASIGGPPVTAVALPTLPDFSRWGEVRREPLARVRKTIAANLANAWSTVPHVTQFDRADITRFEAMRKELNRRSEAADTKLTVTAAVLNAVAGVLGRFPKFNASLDHDAGEIVFKKYVHIGVAVDTDRGLNLDEMTGATFTISNLGGLGTTYFSPIVNWPEVAVLGVGRAEVRAVYDDKQFRPRLSLPLSVSYDHRLIDGAEAARFLRRIADALERTPLPHVDGQGRSA